MVEWTELLFQLQGKDLQQFRHLPPLDQQLSMIPKIIFKRTLISHTTTNQSNIYIYIYIICHTHAFT